MQFQQDWPKKLPLFNFLQENLEKFCLTKLYDAPLEGLKVRATRAKHGYHSLFNHPTRGRLHRERKEEKKAMKIFPH